MSRPRSLPVITETAAGTFRVVGTVYGKQINRTMPTRPEAEALAAEWAGAEPLPLLQTSLSASLIRDAEYLVTTVRDLGLDLRAAARWLVKNYYESDAPPLADAIKAYNASKRAAGRSGGHLAKNERLLADALDFLGDIELCKISVSAVEAWLTDAAGEAAPSYYNDHLQALNGFLRWCKRRDWVQRVVTEPIEPRAEKRTEPVALPASESVRLLRYIESTCPEWTLFFVLTLLAGVRPDLQEGEMQRLHEMLKAGLPVFTDAGVVVLGKGRKGQHRRRVVKWDAVPGLRDWVDAYRPAPGAGVYSGSLWAARTFLESVRARFGLTHDVLRHTAATAMIASGKSYGDTATVMGNSEVVLRASYVSPSWSKPDADVLYSCRPTASLSRPGLSVA